MNKKGAKKYLSFYSLLLFTLAFTIQLTSFGQAHRANHWTFPNENGLDFSNGAPIISFDSLTGVGGTSAISDANGDLILYSNGQKLWNSSGDVVPGGNALLGDQETSQSSLILPSPSPLNPTRYFLFTNDNFGVGNGMTYYEVEMSLNAGLGQVLNPTNLIDSSTEKLAATKHADDKGFWIVGHKTNTDEFHAFSLSETGLNTTPVISSVGIVHTIATAIGEMKGNMKFSPDGTKLAVANFNSGTVQLFDFDNSTGIVSNALTLTNASSQFLHGVEFSADSKKLFFAEDFTNFTSTPHIHQFDLDHASNDCLLASEYIFNHSDVFKAFKDLQLGNDKKIYVNYYEGGLSIDTLGIINSPELLGASINFIKNGLLVGNSMSTFGGLTNFASSYLSDGIYFEFGTNCEDIATQFRPEDTLGLDSTLWNFGDPLSGQNTSNSIFASHTFSSSNDTFLVTLITFSGTQTDTFTRNVINWDRNLYLLGNDTTVCQGQQVALDGSWYNACLEWSNGSTNSTISTSTEGWYWVDVSYQSCVWRDSVYVTEVADVPQFNLGNDTGVCSAINFVIDPNLENAFYTWQDGSHDTTMAVTTTGVYWLLAENACGISSDTLFVTLNQAAQPVLSFPSDTTTCDTIPLTFDVTFLGASYTWNDGFNGSIRTFEESGTYSVQVANACDTVSDTMNLTIQEPIESNLQERYVYCGTNDTLLVTGIENSTNTIWSSGQFGDTAFITQADQYVVSSSNVCGTSIDTFNVLEWDENYMLDIGNDTVLCSDTGTIIVGDANSDYPFNYVWSTDDRSATVLVNVGNYTVTATNRCAILNENISISQAFPVGFGELDNLIICPTEQKSVTTNVLIIDAIAWSHGPTSQEVVLTTPGTYSATITDTNGCVFKPEIVFSDSCPGKVSVDNVFTPNGDFVNDYYCPTLENILDFTFSIYNRWGTEVFIVENGDACWDGELTTGPADNGVYFYILEVEDALGETTSYRGSFSLIR
jgi:gliding motility-associated-like protein